MGNTLYISFSSENSNNDVWSKEMLNALQITLGKIYSKTFQIVSNLEKDKATSDIIEKATIIMLVINSHVPEDYTGDLKIIESKYKDLIQHGKEIFVIVKSHKYSTTVPLFLNKSSQYLFFETNSRTNETIDLTPLIKGEKENKFWSKITDLAYDSKMVLESHIGENKLNESKKLVIYLAEVSKDQFSNREKLKREFLLSGHTVLPSKPLPFSLKEYQEAVRELINQADISVHIMGEIYGDAPNNSDYSYQEIQNRLITEKYGTKEMVEGSRNFFRFVWLPPNLEPYDEKQVHYLKRIKKELSDNSSCEIVQCSLEEFKEIFVQKVKHLYDNPQEEELKSPENNVVLLITDNAQKGIFHKIENQIKKTNSKYELLDLSATGELYSLSTFRQKVQVATNLLVYSSDSEVNWVQGIVGLALKYMISGNHFHENSIAVVAPEMVKEAIDFEALSVCFYSVEDSKLMNHLEEYLIQLPS
jgi:hypothetical protein